MFYLVSYQYAPGTASTNRVMAYVKAFSELGVNTEVVFFMPSQGGDKIERDYPHINFVYLWDKRKNNNKYFDKVFLFYNIKRFIHKLNKDDYVFIYGFVDIVVALKGRSSAHIYSEFTEHPDAAFVSHIPGTTKRRYLEACASFDGVFVISQQLKDYFVENGCQSDRVHIVNMIVDINRFNGLQRHPFDHCITYCGTASNAKDGVDILIKSFAYVVHKYPMYRLLIIGRVPTEKQRFDNLELVKKLGIERNIIFTGAIPSEKIPQILINSDVLALARPDNLQSKYGFPTKLGEYLISGNPVVITNVGDIPLFLQDGINALIAEPSNIEEFAKKLCWVIEHPDESKRIGNAGKKVAIDSFNYLTESKKILDVILGEANNY